MNNIVQTKRTPVAGRRPTGLMAGELYFNFADRTIGCVDENGTPIDIATSISVSALPPAGPVPGLLWYRTAVPAGLYIWFVDADSAQWVQVAGGGSGGGGGGGGGGGDTSVPVGPSPPADPVDGDLWFSTVEPVGLFIWVTDEDGAEWVQVGGAPAENIPIGAVSYFAGPTVPDGWLLCDNQAVSALYPDLRDYLLAAGSPFGTSGADPRVPDLRGEFIRGWDDGSGIDDGRVFGSSQLDQLQRLTARFNNIQFFGGAEETIGIGQRSQIQNSSIWQGASPAARNTHLLIDTLFDPTVRSGSETRPRNVALLPCIKAFDAVDITGMADLAELLTAIATEAEARAGISNEKLMTPANAQALPMIGVGQTWRTIPPADRPVDTPHQNTTGRPIMVATSGRASATASRAVQVSADGVTWVQVGWHPTVSSSPTQTSFVLPAGHYWRIVGAMDAANYLISELS